MKMLETAQPVHAYYFEDGRGMKRADTPMSPYMDGGWCSEAEELAKFGVKDEWITLEDAAEKYWVGARVVRSSLNHDDPPTLHQAALLPPTRLACYPPPGCLPTLHQAVLPPYQGGKCLRVTRTSPPHTWHVCGSAYGNDVDLSSR